MGTSAVLYLAHLNPVTKAHEQIITSLLDKGYSVYVFPVRFLKEGREINTRSFPFTFEHRKEMVEAIFGDAVRVLPDYTFYAPFVRYMPPLLSPRSWELRNQIVSHVEEDRFVSYTGDKAERLMLKVYRLNPLKADRLEISASSVKDMLYREALDGTRDTWRSMVPSPVVRVIERNWSIIEMYANCEDATTRIMGMKFPKEGYK
jgi:nicotinamide mononucleotide adenylyltransferase